MKTKDNIIIIVTLLGLIIGIIGFMDMSACLLSNILGLEECSEEVKSRSFIMGFGGLFFSFFVVLLDKEIIEKWEVNKQAESAVSTGPKEKK